PYIKGQCKKRGWTHVRAVKENVDTFQPEGTFDRIVSVEMFEHMRNYAELFQRMSTWCKPDGLLFVHIFAHREVPYLFEAKDDADWMSRYFFGGGTMPSHELLPSFDQEFERIEDWRINGIHYSKTLEAWLKRLDARKPEAMSIMEQTYGARDAALWFQRWRIFLMACSELFAFDDGREWGVSHYRFAPGAMACAGAGP
ncbi:MAG: class I SAM-dependent methyltransferase, partial [Verrucomicrobiota bacterium]